MVDLPEPIAPSNAREEDPLLARFRAAESGQREVELRVLVDAVARPALAQEISRRASVALGPDGRAVGSGSADALDAEDAASLAVHRLVRSLLHSDTRIANVRAYCGKIAFHAWSDTMYRRAPARQRLIHRVRYTCEGSVAQRNGLALWFDDGDEVVGFEVDRNAAEPCAPEAVRAVTDRAEAFLRAHFSGQRLLALKPAELLGRLFAALGAPLRWSDLEDVLGALWVADGGRAEGRTVGSEEAERMPEPASAQPNPAEQLSWLENLTWLWQAVLALELPHRTAFLLHSPVTRELNWQGVATLRQLAAALDLAPEELLRLWPDIPLDDLTIAARLGVERQKVINLRKTARVALGRKLAEYLAD